MLRRVTDANTNICYFSKLFLDRSYGMNIIQRISGNGIDLRILHGTRDIWCRDYMPIQIYENQFVGYEYAPDYLDYLGGLAYQTNPVRILKKMKIDAVPTGLIIDGGNVIRTSKSIIMVDKVFQENSHLRKETVINRLERYFDCEIIFLPWDKEEKYGHADGIVRYMDNDRVLMTNYHQYDKKYAQKYEKILSKYFDVVVLDFKVKNPCKYNWCYINFLQVGNIIFLPQLRWEDYSQPDEVACRHSGVRNYAKPKWYDRPVEEDDLALEQFQRLFPECEIIQVSCPHIVENGGALNCISWNVKL